MRGYYSTTYIELVETTSTIQKRRKDMEGSTKTKQIKQGVQGTGRCLTSTYGTVAVVVCCCGVCGRLETEAWKIIGG